MNQGEAVFTSSRHSTVLVWQTYAWWATWVGIVFFAVYPSCNWLTARRDPSALWRLYGSAELNLPLVPQFIWAYFSMYLLFLVPPLFLDVPALRRLGKRLIAVTVLGGAIFLVVPCELGFTRVVPTQQPYAAIFARMFTLDLPFNTMPSLHVAFSALIIHALARSRRWLRWPAYAWLALIGLSTVLVHQHHIIDVVSGWLLAFWLDRDANKEERHVEHHFFAHARSAGAAALGDDRPSQ